MRKDLGLEFHAKRWSERQRYELSWNIGALGIFVWIFFWFGMFFLIFFWVGMGSFFILFGMMFLILFWLGWGLFFVWDDVFDIFWLGWGLFFFFLRGWICFVWFGMGCVRKCCFFSLHLDTFFGAGSAGGVEDDDG